MVCVVVSWVCGAFVGVLRSQASCFSLLVGFSWLEILLFPFCLCGCETLALLLNLAIILLCLLGLTLFAHHTVS